MKKVFIIHGFEGRPNGGWRPWLMAELEKQDVYACALALPNPDEPLCTEWVEEISRQIAAHKQDEIYLVGHSLGVPAILRYLETADAQNIRGAVLVAGPCEKNENKKLDSFLEAPFDFERITSRCNNFAIIHGDTDPLVPIQQGEYLSERLQAPLSVVKDGGHLNGSAGWYALPDCLTVLQSIL